MKVRLSAPTEFELQARCAYPSYIQPGRSDGFDWLQAKKELKENGNQAPIEGPEDL